MLTSSSIARFGTAHCGGLSVRHGMEMGVWAGSFAERSASIASKFARKFIAASVTTRNTNTNIASDKDFTHQGPVSRNE